MIMPSPILSCLRLPFAFLLALLLWTAAPAEIQIITHHSEALQKDQTYRAYVPKDAAADRRYPVLYVLHGATGGSEDWVKMGGAEQLAEHYRMILIFPDGGEYGWYVDSPVEPASQYETYMTKELLPDVDSRFPTVAKREARGIMGLSMGGHGALSLAAKHPDLYSSASSLSGILRLENHPDRWHIVARLGPYAENEAVWKANSVYDLAEKFATNDVRILFDCGVDDTKTGAITDARELDARLTELKIPHIYRELPGTHNWGYWTANLEAHLNFHQAMLSQEVAGLKSTDAGFWFQFYYKREKLFLTENAKIAVDAPTTPTLCLLGSSSAQGMGDALFPGVRVFNRGISADVLGLGSRGISHRMEESVFDMKPDYVVFKIGRNDISARQGSKNGEPSLEHMVAAYDDIMTRIQTRLPKAKLIITSSFPVRDKYARLAEPILPWNEELKKLATKHNVPYLDIHKELVGEDNLARPENSADGLHLSAAGKKVWAEAILKEIGNGE
ncbi:hypothetical protein BH09SUM1_BH09SUM1_02600 [soil metagenome]